MEEKGRKEKFKSQVKGFRLKRGSKSASRLLAFGGFCGFHCSVDGGQVRQFIFCTTLAMKSRRKKSMVRQDVKQHSYLK